MAGAPISQPGSAGSSNKYPQYSYDQSGNIVKAANKSQKLNYIDQGDLNWFTSRQAAVNSYNSQQGILGTGGGNPLTGLNAIGDFFSKLGEANTWLRIGEVGLGLILISIGIAKMTKAIPVATKIAKTAGAIALA